MTDRLFIVGAQRCGTTYLYRVLDAHPEIEMARPVRPEPKFFLDDAAYGRGLDYYEATFYTGGPGVRIRGEKSTSYLESEKAAERIARAFPEAKILVILRDPVARAISHWRFSTENGIETLPMAEAFRREAERREDYDHDRFSVSPFAYLERGRYVDDLAVYDRLFPPENIKVLVHERFMGVPAAIQDLYGYLGVAADFLPDGIAAPVNESDPATLPDRIPEALLTELKASFADANARLASRLGGPIPEWG